MNKKNWNRGIPLILLGIIGIFVSVFCDRVGFGNPGFGTFELSGLIIGAILTAAGTVQVLFPNPLLLLRLLAGIYVIGTLYFGLKPEPGNYSPRGGTSPDLSREVSIRSWKKTGHCSDDWQCAAT